MNAGNPIKRLLGAYVLLLFVSVSSICAAQSQAGTGQGLQQSSQPSPADKEVWISPNDPTHGGATDFWDMFQPGADWAQAEHHVRVVGIAQNLVTNGPADKLKVFYAIDEALWFGRYFSRAGACHSEVNALASDVAANFKEYQAIFPDVRLGDTEPLGPPPSGDPTGLWAQNTQAWIDALQAATGQHLAFVHEDITDWSRPLPGYLSAVAKLVHSNHIPFAPIIIAASGMASGSSRDCNLAHLPNTQSPRIISRCVHPSHRLLLSRAPHHSLAGFSTVQLTER